VYIGDDQGKLPSGKSRSFTIRTTEKEKEIVQVALDRLLREKNEKGELVPLLITAQAKPFTVEGSAVTLTFEHADGTPFNKDGWKNEGVSPAYFRDFLVRSLKTGTLREEADSVTVVGVPSADPDIAAKEGQAQRYAALSVDFSRLNTVKTLLDTPGKQDEAKGFISENLTKAADAFKSRPVPERLETFDPSLAKDTRGKALMAILLSWAAILGFLWFRFGSWRHGLAAILCLIHDLCFTLGAIAVCHYLHDTMVGRLLALKDFKIDLAAVAALLTLVGYSVNEIIVNFARLREVRGKSPVLTPQMINASVNQTLSRTILTSMTVALVSLVLYAFGGEGIHLFAFVMLTGVIISTYSSIYVASPLLLIFGEGKPRVPTAGGPTGDGGEGGDQAADRPTETASASAIAS